MITIFSEKKRNDSHFPFLKCHVDAIKLSSFSTQALEIEILTMHRNQSVLDTSLPGSDDHIQQRTLDTYCSVRFLEDGMIHSGR